MEKDCWLWGAQAQMAHLQAPIAEAQEFSQI